MKVKYVVLFVALLVLLPIAKAEPVIIASDDFESGTFTGGTGWVDDWQSYNLVDIITWDDPYEGSRHARLRGANGEGSTMSRTINVEELDEINLSVAIKMLGDVSGFIIINDGSENTTLDEITIQEEYNLYEYNVEGLEQTELLTFYFHVDGQWNSHVMYVDAVQIMGYGESPPSNETQEDVIETGYGYYIEKYGKGYRLVVGDAVTYYDGLNYIPVWRNIFRLQDEGIQFEDYGLGVETSKYNAYFKEVGGNVQLVSFVSNNTRVIYQPQVLGWINIWDGRDNMAMPQTSNYTKHENKITYNELYGEGIDLAYTAYGNFLRKEIHIKNKSYLAPPPSEWLDWGPVDFYAEYLLTMNNVDRLVVNGEDWDFQTNTSTTSDILVVNDQDDVLYKIKEPYVLDAEGTKHEATYFLFEESGSYRIRIIVPYETLWEEVVYPIIIDPTTGYEDEPIPIMEIELDDEFSPLEKITLYNITGEGNLLINNNLSDLRGSLVNYAIDPEDLQFDYGEINAKEAQGDVLLKCEDWNFETEECGTCVVYDENDTCILRNETWVYAGTLVAGETYSFMFDNVDPAYGEYQLSLGESSTVSTIFVNKVQHSFTPQTHGYYLIMGTGALAGSSTGNSVFSRMTLNNDLIYGHNHRPRNANRALDYPTFAGFTVQELNTSTHTINIDYRSGGGGALAYIRDASITTMLLEDYHYNESLAEQQVAPSPSTFLNSIFTANHTGEYLVLASGEYRSEATNKLVSAYLYQNNTLLETTGYYPQHNTDYMTFMYVRLVNLTEGQTYNFNIRADRDSGGADSQIRNLRVLAFPITEELDFNYAESNALSETSSQTPVTKNTLTFTPEYPGDYYINAYAQITHGNDGRAVTATVLVNNVETICTGIKTPSNGDNWYTFNCMIPYNFTNQSYDITMTYQSSGPGNVARIRNSRLQVISITEEHLGICDYPGSGPWQFLEDIYCHITQFFIGDGSNILLASTNTTRFSVGTTGFTNITITNSSTMIIDNSSTITIGPST